MPSTFLTFPVQEAALRGRDDVATARSLLNEPNHTNLYAGALEDVVLVQVFGYAGRGCVDDVRQ
jgi:hypothetical protein